MPSRHRKSRILHAAKNEAVLAVDLYNRPTNARRLEGFIVHMGIAWLYLAHAVFKRDGIDYRYWNDKKVVRVDGEPRTWDLGMSIKELYQDANDPVRRNVEFFIRFRNKIEHRYSPIVEAVIAGKAQSYIVNFEEKLVREFGQRESLGQALHLPVFLTTLTEDAVAAVKSAFVLLPARIRNFITDYDAQLPEEVRNHSAYDFRLYLIPKTSSKAQADAAIEFVKLSDLTPEQREKIDESLVIIRDRQVGVANKGSMRPTMVTKAVQARIPWKFRTTPEHFRAANISR